MASKEISLETLGIRPYKKKSGEDYMSAEMHKHFHEVLSKTKDQIMVEAQRTVTHMKEEANNHADPNDRATQEEEFRLELRTRDRERKLLKKIEEALQLIADDEYGYCEACGIEIGLLRLEARPTATLCIDCKQREELKEKQMASD
jgi:DnaK suppressor protein